jgi:chromosome segregation ATPase
MGRNARPGGSTVRSIKLLASSFFIVGLSFASSVAIAQQQDQSQVNTGDPVADAARKAREQRKTAAKPKRVFTDDDVVTKPAADVPAPSETSQSPDKSGGSLTQGKAPTAKNDIEKKEDPNSEAAWRKRFAAQRRKISDAEEELSVLQREAEKADLQYYNDPQKALQEQYTRAEINAKNEKIAEKKKEIADLKQQLSDLEDQLRSSGGDPGWAR